MNTAISVVIPVHDSAETIRGCLDSLMRMNREDVEVIVVDDGSTDDTASICESYGSVRVIRLRHGGPSRARNRGIAEAKGHLIAFTDGDCIVEPDWLSQLEKGFTSPEVAGVGGDQKSPEDETPTGRTIQEFLKTIGFMTGYIKTHAAMTETDHNPTCNSCYRREVLQEVGGFDEKLWPSEDVELDLRITRRGYKLMYNPAAVVAHYRPKTFRDFGLMMRRYGASQWSLVQRYGFFRKLHFEPLALFVGLAVYISLVSWEPRLWPLILLPVPAAAAWFLMKTRNPAKSLRFLWLFTITLVNWNRGFLAGDRPKPPNPNNTHSNG